MAQIKYQIAKQIGCVDVALEGQFLAQIKYQIFEQIRCVDAALWDGVYPSDFEAKYCPFMK